MITMSSGTFLALFGLGVTILGAAFGLIYKAGAQLGRFDVTMGDLASAVKELSSTVHGLGERLVRVETKLEQQERD